MKGLTILLLVTVCVLSVDAFPLVSKQRRTLMKNSDMMKTDHDFFHRNYVEEYDNWFLHLNTLNRRRHMQPWMESRVRHPIYSSLPWLQKTYLSARQPYRNYFHSRYLRRRMHFKTMAMLSKYYRHDQRLCLWNTQPKRVNKLLTHALNRFTVRKYTVKEIIFSTESYRKNIFSGYQTPGKHDVIINFRLAPTDGCDWRMKCDCKPRRHATETTCWVSGSFQYGKTNVRDFKLKCRNEMILKKTTTKTVATTTKPTTTSTSTTTLQPVTTTIKTTAEAKPESDYDESGDGSTENVSSGYSGDAAGGNPQDEESGDSEKEYDTDVEKLPTRISNQETDVIDALDEEFLFMTSKPTTTTEVEPESDYYESGDGSTENVSSGYSGEAAGGNPQDKESGDSEEEHDTDVEKLLTRISNQETDVIDALDEELLFMTSKTTTTTEVEPETNYYESGDGSTENISSGYSGDAIGGNPQDQECGDSESVMIGEFDEADASNKELLHMPSKDATTETKTSTAATTPTPQATTTAAAEAKTGSDQYESGDGSSESISSGYSGDAIGGNPQDEESGDDEDAFHTDNKKLPMRIFNEGLDKTSTTKPTTTTTSTTTTSQTTAAEAKPKNNYYESGDGSTESISSGYSGDAIGRNPQDEESGDSEDEFDIDIEKLPARIFNEDPITMSKKATKTITAAEAKPESNYNESGDEFTDNIPDRHTDIDKLLTRIFHEGPAAKVDALDKGFLIHRLLN